jgi:hypothetical protein
MHNHVDQNIKEKKTEKEEEDENRIRKTKKI